MAIKRQITIWAVGERMPKKSDGKRIIVFFNGDSVIVYNTFLNTVTAKRYGISHWCELPEIETAFERARKEKNDERDSTTAE